MDTVKRSLVAWSWRGGKDEQWNTEDYGGETVLYESYFAWYYDDGYMSLHICPNA